MNQPKILLGLVVAMENKTIRFDLDPREQHLKCFWEGESVFVRDVHALQRPLGGGQQLATRVVLRSITHVKVIRSGCHNSSQRQYLEIIPRHFG